MSTSPDCPVPGFGPVLTKFQVLHLAKAIKYLSAELNNSNMDAPLIWRECKMLLEIIDRCGNSRILPPVVSSRWLQHCVVRGHSKPLRQLATMIDAMRETPPRMPLQLSAKELEIARPKGRPASNRTKEGNGQQFAQAAIEHVKAARNRSLMPSASVIRAKLSDLRSKLPNPLQPMVPSEFWRCADRFFLKGFLYTEPKAKGPPKGSHQTARVSKR